MTRLSVISLVLVIAVVFAVLIGAMFATGLLEVPSFIQKIFGQNEEELSPGLPDDLKILYDALQKGGDELIITHTSQARTSKMRSRPPRLPTATRLIFAPPFFRAMIALYD